MHCYSTKIYQVYSAVSLNTGTVLFLLYVNDLPNSSIVLVPLMFAEDTSFLFFFFFEHSNKNALFKTINEELIKINEWFCCHLTQEKPSLHYSTNHAKKYSILSPLPTLKINNHDIKGVVTMKFLGVLLHENLSWKEHMKYLENKIAKNI